MVIKTSNAVFVGGEGYQYPYSTGVGNKGVLNIDNGAEFLVGADCWLVPGVHIDIGTASAKSEGAVNVSNGSALHAGYQLVVGSGSSTGYLKATGGSTVDLVRPDHMRNTAGTISVLIGSAAGSEGYVSIENGSTFYIERALGTNTYSFVEVGKSGHGELLVTGQGSVADFSNTLTIVGETAGSTGLITVEDGGKLVLGQSPYTVLGYAQAGAHGTIDVKETGTVEAGVVSVGLYGTGTITNAGTFNAVQVVVNSGSDVTNSGGFDAGLVQIGGTGVFTNKDGGTVTSELTYLSGLATLETDTLHVSTADMDGAYNTATLVNLKAATSTVECTDFTVENGSVYNYGLLDAQSGIELGDGAYLLTGTLTVAGKEDAANNGDPATLEYSTGLTEGTKVTVSGTKDVAVGALVTSKTGNTQYVSGDDLKAMDAKVLAGLELTADQAKVVNELDSTVKASLTTGEVNDKSDSVIVAVEGASVTIDKSPEPEAPTVGTIGSFSEVVTETKASIRVTEVVTPKDNEIVWKGDDLKTIEGETTVFTSQTAVTTDSTNPASQLVVVENSTLDNQGTINSQVQVDGTLKGTGTVNGTVNVNAGGCLVIGNSPGYMAISNLTLTGNLVISVDGVETASTSGNTGWGSGTYSQLTLTEGRLSMLDGASISILFGGDTIFDGTVGKEIAFDMAIISGITNFTINGEDAISSGSLTETAVKFLVDNSHLALTGEILGLPSIGEMYSDLVVSEVTYTVEASGVEGKYDLHVKGKMVVPETTTTTLSLLALAALAARRRRRK